MEQSKKRFIFFYSLLSLLLSAEIAAVTSYISGASTLSKGITSFILLFLLVLLPPAIGSRPLDRRTQPAYGFLWIHLAAVCAFAAYYYIFVQTAAQGSPVQLKLFYSVPVVVLAHWALTKTFYSTTPPFRWYVVAAVLASLLVKHYRLFLRLKIVWTWTCWSVGFLVERLLCLTGFTSTFSCPPGTSLPTIGTDQFSVLIATPCSGIEGLTSFTLLFAIMVALNWRTTRKGRAVVAGIGGLAFMYCINIIRIYILILIGHFVGSQKAVDMWHSQGSLVFYVITLIVLLSAIQKWISVPAAGQKKSSPDIPRA